MERITIFTLHSNIPPSPKIKSIEKAVCITAHKKSDNIVVALPKKNTNNNQTAMKPSSTPTRNHRSSVTVASSQKSDTMQQPLYSSPENNGA